MGLNSDHAYKGPVAIDLFRAGPSIHYMAFPLLANVWFCSPSWLVHVEIERVGSVKLLEVQFIYACTKLQSIKVHGV